MSNSSLSRRLIVPVLALVLASAVEVEAQRRRAVRFPAPAPVSGQCHEFGLVEPGTKASYVANAPSGNASFTITWISDTPTKTVTTQHVVTPQATSDVTTVLDGEVVGNLRGLKHINIKTTTAVPIVGSFTVEVDIDFVPTLVAGPADGWCMGNTWIVAPVTETITTKSPVAPPVSQIVTTIASEGEVLAVGDFITVTGGTFETVKYRGAVVSGTSVQEAITWVSMEHNIVVRQDTVENGVVTSTLELTKLN